MDRGNISGRDPQTGYVAINHRGAYETAAEHMVILDLDGQQSRATSTLVGHASHLYIYRTGPMSTAWCTPTPSMRRLRRGGQPIPVYLTATRRVRRSIPCAASP